MEIIYKNIITKNEAFRMVLYLLIGLILYIFILFKHFYSISLSNREYTSSFIVLAAMLILSGIFQIFLYFRLIYSVSFDKEILLIDFMYGKNESIDINSIDFLLINKNKLFFLKVYYTCWFSYKEYMFSKGSDILCFRYNKKIYYISNKSDLKLKEYLYNRELLN
ncbi:hypothetical protein [Aliivibrio fischeri]|uniref:hypothetical protein n=1 Tax=Aliivibrio fischeri TaxID=668 RepID=UPI00080EE68A|nr:hypothetical protein [Aliivibrio fischeri]OCH08328.1 hypothetical protein A6E11_12550 [Aliivibrio fischeri]